jgi:ABC-2 type transport system permease protein
MLEVLRKSLWDQRRGILVGCIGLAAIGVLYAGFYPIINTPELRAYMDAFPEELLTAMGFTDISSPTGYIGSTTYGLLGPIVTIIIATALGARAIAGDEEAGRLDVLLAHPIERGRFLMGRAVAMFVALALAGLALFVAMVIVAGPAQFTEIPTVNLAAASLQMVLLGSLFGALALAVGALTGRRSLAAGSVVVVAVVTYFANTLGPSVEWLAWTRDVSPFHYYSGGQPLRNGLQAGDALILGAVAVALIVLGVIAFRRRDIAV